MMVARASCFLEDDPRLALGRRAAVEGIGTSLLVFVAVGSSTAAARLFPGAAAAAVLMSAVAIPAALVSLVVAFGRVSGGHYNPLITLLQLLAGERSAACALTYISVQLVGGGMGGVIAACLWRTGFGATAGLGAGGALSELIASAGLMLVVVGAARSGRPETGPFAVGAWLGAAIVATPTGSYANPAVVLGAALSSGPIALSRGSAAWYVAAEVTGTFLALLLLPIIAPAGGSGS